MHHQIGIVAIIAVALLVTGVGAAAPVPDGFGKYHDLDRAIEDGYVLASPCVPGMGFHYAKFELVDETVKVSQAEVLVYAGANGDELVAVEYVATVPFSLLGDQAEFHPHLGAWALHAWYFLHNPDGLTSDFNPRVNSDCTID